MKRTRLVALGGVLAALSAALLYLGGLLPGYAVAAAAAAGLLPAAAVLRGGIKTGAAVYVVTALLALLLLPTKTAAIWYAVFFGYYGLLKSLLERLKSRVLEWICKVGVYSAAFGLMALLLRSVLTAAVSLSVSLIVLYAVGLAAFVLYDFGYSGLIGLYLRRIDRNLGKGES